MRTGIHDANDDPLIMKVDRGGCPDDVGTAVGPDGAVAELMAMRDAGTLEEVSLGMVSPRSSLRSCLGLTRHVLLARRTPTMKSTRGFQIRSFASSASRRQGLSTPVRGDA